MGSTVKCCYKCEERWVKDGQTCHSTCKRYLEERAALDAKNDMIRKARMKRITKIGKYAHEPKWET